MSRKYRQRGYMDHSVEDRRGRDDDAKRQVPISSVIKIIRCAGCRERNETLGKIKPDAECQRCGAALHSCRHCVYFDLKAANQCQRPEILAIKDKEAANDCPEFSAKFELDQSLNRPMTEEEARRALNRLFKL